MTLRQLQSVFARRVGLLIAFAYEVGYELTFGDAWAKTGHKKNSNHYIRLAIDLNLFKAGKYLSSTESHRVLGEFWESLSTPDSVCAWGGRFQDGNHYSMEYKGRK